MSTRTIRTTEDLKMRNKALIKEVKIVEYFALIDPELCEFIHPHSVVQVRTIDTHELFNVYEAQVRKFNYRGGETFFVQRYF